MHNVIFKTTKILSFLISGFFFLLVLPNTASSTTFSQARFFGDSLTDTGNNYWIKSTGRIGAPITNWPYYPRQGATWANFLLYHYFGKHAQLETYAEAHARKFFSFFVNYAYASAETLDGYTNDIMGSQVVHPICTNPGFHPKDSHSSSYSCVPGLRKQVALYLQAEKPNPQTLYFLWAGGNDLLRGLVTHMLPTPPISAPAALTSTERLPIDISIPINNTRKAVLQLLGAGVQGAQIVVVDMPDFTKTPVFIPASSDKLKLMVHKLVLAYNESLKQELATLSKKIRILSSYNELSKLVLDTTNFVAMAEKRPCVADARAECCLDEQARHYMFFDAKHPTQYTHEQIGVDFGEQLKQHD